MSKTLASSVMAFEDEENEDHVPNTLLLGGKENKLEEGK